MIIIGHKLKNISAERGELKGRISVSSNVQVTNVEKDEFFAAGEKKAGLNFEFLYDVAYGENAGKIRVEGSVYAVDEPKELDKIAKRWEKENKVDPELAAPVLNRAMELGIVQAIPLANNLGLPTPIRIPRVIPSPEPISETKQKKAKE